MRLTGVEMDNARFKLKFLNDSTHTEGFSDVDLGWLDKMNEAIGSQGWLSVRQGEIIDGLWEKADSELW